MKRLHILFGVILLIFSLPLWRMLDYVALMSPESALYSAALSLVLIVTILLPLRLIFTFKNRWLGLVLISILVITFTTKPLSSKGTLEPKASHCGGLTYTGFLYPIHEFLTEANADDLLVRNQFCWLRKLVLKVPELQISQEQEIYLKLLEKKLLKPQDKFLASLPLIALLYGHVTLRLQDNLIQKVEGGKFLMESLHFWRTHYTLEISHKNYAWWDWPYSAWIQFEYGLIENNWEGLIDHLEFN